MCESYRALWREREGVCGPAAALKKQDTTVWQAARCVSAYSTIDSAEVHTAWRTRESLVMVAAIVVLVVMVAVVTVAVAVALDQGLRHYSKRGDACE